jgi:site-specific recombinase XerD
MLKHKGSYLRYKQTYTKGAYKTYGLWLDKFDEAIGKSEEDVRVEDILNFKIWLQSRFSGKSVQYAMTILHNYFVFLNLNNIKCLNPGLIRSPVARANSYQAIAPEDYQKILMTISEFIPKNELRYMQELIIVRILGETGVRVSELVSITIDSLDLNVCGTLIENRKNKDNRWIYWSAQTNDLLRKFLPIREHLKRGTRALFVGCFINDQGITTRTVERIVRDWCKKAGIKNVVPHSFRHGKAHYILEKGGTIADVQKTLGHKSPISSMKYLQYSDKEHQRRSKMFFPEVQESIFTLKQLDTKMSMGI